MVPINRNYSRTRAAILTDFRLLKGDWLAIEGAFESSEGGMSMLTSGREIASDTAEVPGSIRSSKAARDFLLQLDHPQVTFRTIVVEGHSEVRHEAQDFIAAALQSFDEIVWQRFQLPPFLLRGIC